MVKTLNYIFLTCTNKEHTNYMFFQILNLAKLFSLFLFNILILVLFI